MNRYNDPKDSSAFAEKRHYVNLSDQTLKRFWSKIDRQGECWFWKKRVNNKGYGVFYINRKWPVTANRVSFLISRGYLPTGLEVCHKCDNPRCVKPDHLFSGTHLENMQDMVQKGRSNLGEKHHTKKHPEWIPRGSNRAFAKLNDALVQEIRMLHVEGFTYKEISKKFEVCVMTICNIVRRKLWDHVP